MRKVIKLLFSTRLMAVIIAIFGISIAVATFIENDFGSQTAKAVVYNANWFEIMLFVGIINLLGVIIINKLYVRAKITIFIFHLSFFFILLGAAITHFFGFEGIMHIREGETSNQVISSNSYLCVLATSNNQTTYAEKPINYSAFSNNHYSVKLDVAGKHVKVESLQIIPNAVETLIDDSSGEPILSLVVAGSNGKETILLSDKQLKKIGNIVFSLNDTSATSGVSFITKNGLQFRSANIVIETNMASQVQDTLNANEYHSFALRTLYNFKGIQVVATDFKLKGKMSAMSMNETKPGELPSAMQIRVSSGNASDTIFIFSRQNNISTPVDVKLNQLNVSVLFGAKVVELPFSLQLKKFILQHYAGSESPSSFESKITLRDNAKNLQEEHRIYMNNVLEYNGFRFYQSSYDTDEKGTILSVNYDFWGTWVTYFAYLMLALGIILSIFNKNSRFRSLSAELSKIRKLRTTAGIITFFMLFSLPNNARAQNILPDSIAINAQHSAHFGELLIQDMGGRIKPINSLSSELLRKVSRNERFMGQTSDQVLLGMIVYPEVWQRIPMIKVSHPQIKEILNITDDYASFLDFLDASLPNHPYLLNKYVDEAYRKKPASRDKFDSEIIKVDERVNLCYMVYSGNLLRIFPKENDDKNTWYAPANIAFAFKGDDSLYMPKLIPLYIQSIREALRTGNWEVPEDLLLSLNGFQHKRSGSIMPSDFKVKTEILYNKANVFDRIGGVYGITGFILLLFQFFSVFRPMLKLKLLIRISVIVIVACFLLHLAGLLARWYISGHAPWSNAYESLVFIAFATVLAGVIFSRKSGITISATALLAWLILFVAHLNWMDPEITNLVPVLKSYWLLIHVAVITASYGFLALGALLAFINLSVMVFQSQNNFKTTDGIVTELTIIIEMTLIIGLFMLSIGTFLGGVWANESWGRYWGWDPKETWALVSVLVYAFILHMRLVPGLKGNFVFNVMALLGFSSIVMTYFGVNYYLSGLHSYAKGDALPIPPFVYYSLAIIALLVSLAWINQRKLHKLKNN